MEDISSLSDLTTPTSEPHELDYYDQEQDDNDIANNIEEIGKEEYDRLTKKMFPKWSKDTSKISKFMQSLDPHKEYTNKEIKELSTKFNIQLNFLITY